MDGERCRLRGSLFCADVVNPHSGRLRLRRGRDICLHFFYLDHRAIRIKCPYGRCQEIIETNTPWICGNKGCKNENVDEFPFIYKCEHCGYYPKAYKCHHCGELIYFTDDEQKTGYAECANYALRAAIVKKREGHQEMMINKREVVESKGLDVDIGKLDIRLKGIKKVLDPPPPPPPPPPSGQSNAENADAGR